MRRQQAPTCYDNKVLWYLITVLTYQSHVTTLCDIVLSVSRKRVSPPRPNKFLFFLPLFKRGYLEGPKYGPLTYFPLNHTGIARLAPPSTRKEQFAAVAAASTPPSLTGRRHPLDKSLPPPDPSQLPPHRRQRHAPIPRIPSCLLRKKES